MNRLVLTSVLLAACASRPGAPAIAPNDIPALEAAVAVDPEHTDRLTLLGAAYYDTGRFEDAAHTLQRAVAQSDAPSVAHLYLGLSFEASEDWQAASDAYTAFLANAPADSELRSDIEQRVTLVERHLMAEQLRSMLAQEAALTNQAATPRTVAVLPFRVVTDDPRYQPLQMALADMVTTDLGIPGTLQLLERARIQVLVQEMALSLAGYTDASSGARVGRLMRAEHVVQGSVVLLGEERLRMEMVVVDPGSAVRRGEAADEVTLAQIFDAEKRLVLQVLGLLGVTLTAAEREAIEENRTANLLALLSYGEGLEALDRGDFAAATAAFQNAAQIDPGFEAAQLRAQEAAGLEQAVQTTGPQIAATALSELPDMPPAPTPEAARVQLVDRIIPDINRSGSDLIAGNTSDGGELQDDQTIEDRNSNAGGGAGGTVLTIDIDNPNVP